MRLTKVWQPLLRLALRSPATAGRQPRRRPPNRRLCLEILEDRSLLSTLTVLNNLDSGAGSLRDTIEHASSGDTIVFSPSLIGQTITLTSDQLTITKNLDIEGPGAALLAISGNDANQVFSIHEQGLTVTVANLTITHGRAHGSNATHVGAAFVNDSSNLGLANDIISHNEYDGAGGGGAIVNLYAANLTITNSTFCDNQAIGPPGASVGGAALVVFPLGKPSSVMIDRCAFLRNRSVGGDGGVFDGSKVGFVSIGVADGGAIHADGPITITNSTFTGNQAIAGNGGLASNAQAGGVDFANGGAIFSHEGGLVLSGDTFSCNEAVGGSNATCINSVVCWVGTGVGGALNNIETATVTNCSFDHNQARGGSGNTGGSGNLIGTGRGGGIFDGAPGFAANLTASNLTFTDNRAVGGAGNSGDPLAGAGVGGALQNGFGAPATVSNSMFSGNQAIGGQGSPGMNGADGLGGALANFPGSTLTVSNCTLTGNQAMGGAGGAGGNGGNGFGGGLYNDGTSTFTVTGSTITLNQATGGAAGAGGSDGTGIGGGAYFAAGGVVCLDSFTQTHAKENRASTSDDDLFGDFTIC
jgi:hypothetical protein